MIINHNMASLNTYNKMSINTANTSKSLEKLSSGLRINKAGDDAAGLAISEKMRGQIRGLDQASRNAQDGISMISTAEGGLSETQSILQRMKELATQAANDTNVKSDRSEIQKEINQLSSEINRIGNTTEFNTQKLLKGKDVAVVSTAQTVATTSAGVAGVITGATSALSVDTKSVAAVASSTSVQGKQAAATGAIKDYNVDVASEAGTRAVATLTSGLSFSSKAVDGTLNTKTIELKMATGTTNNTFTKDGSGNYTLTIGADNTYANSGELYNAAKTAYDAYVTGGGTDDLVLAKPANTASSIDMDNIAETQTLTGGSAEKLGTYSFVIDKAFTEAGDSITIEGKSFKAVTGVANAANGEFTIGTATVGAEGTSLKDAINSVFSGKYLATDDTAGKVTLTEVATTADGKDLAAPTVAGYGSDDKLNITDLTGKNLNEVNITKSVADAAGTKATSAETIDTSFKLTAGTAGTGLNGIKVTFSALTSTASATALTTSWDAEKQTMTVSGNILNTANQAAFGASLKSTLDTAFKDLGIQDAGITVTAGAAAAGGIHTALNAAVATFETGKTAVADADTMVVDQNNGKLTINLANTTASKNTAAKIEEAVHKLGKVSTSTGEVDFTQYKFTTEGNWDTKTVGGNIADANGTLTGGTQEVQGVYSFTADKLFAAKDVVDIQGQKFTAVSGTADATKGEFSVDGDLNAQAAGIRAAVNANATLSAKFTAAGTANQVVLTEKEPSGTDLKVTDLAVKAIGTAGEYSIDTSKLLENGAAFVIDGEKITVSSKEANVGYADGTAIKVADTAAGQTSALADAINKNADLSIKYTASVGTDGSLVLKQNEAEESATAPAVATQNSSIGQFTSSFQIGANSGQSITIDVNDMRSSALGITGDGSATTVAAKNGLVASYVAISNVTNGTDNTNVEFALDVSDHTKATNAISILSDAIESVSAERSKIGAYQNRLEHTIANLGTSSENLTSAESRVRDVDMAKEMMQFQKNNILSQAAQAMMAQANQQPQGVLQLLR